jgi:hypothetical protein
MQSNYEGINLLTEVPTLLPEYRKITVGVFLHPEEHGITPAGERYWNPFFMDRLNDYQGYFSILLQDDLVKCVGEKGWGIKFIQESQEMVSWFVDIYVDDDSLYSPICSVIRQYTPEVMKLTFFKKGAVRDYLN